MTARGRRTAVKILLWMGELLSGRQHLRQRIALSRAASIRFDPLDTSPGCAMPAVGSNHKQVLRSAIEQRRNHAARFPQPGWQSRLLCPATSGLWKSRSTLPENCGSSIQATDYRAAFPAFLHPLPTLSSSGLLTNGNTCSKASARLLQQLFTRFLCGFSPTKR